METFLWWVIGIVIAVVLLAALIPSIYKRTMRRRDRKLGNRAKRRIEL